MQDCYGFGRIVFGIGFFFLYGERVRPPCVSVSESLIAAEEIED